MMKILSVKISNVKSISENSDELNFKNSDDLPCSTVIIGENGVGKSTFLECISLLSHVNYEENNKNYDLIQRIHEDPRKRGDKSYIEINLRQKNLGEEIDGKIIFCAYSEGGALPCSKTASLISTHIINQALLKKHWKVYFCINNTEEFNKQFLFMLKFNRPPEPMDDDITKFDIENHANMKTKRSLLLRQKDIGTPKLFDEQIENNSFICLVNTDQNAFGNGFNVFESPKNIKYDLPKVLFRLPCLEKKENDKYVLRQLKKISRIWKDLFGKELNDISCQWDRNEEKWIGNINIKNQQGESIKGLESVSSGENEILFMLICIISCHAKNCIFLLDEPELHVADKSLGNYFKILFKSANENNNQIIFISHHPLYFSIAKEKIIRDAYIENSNNPITNKFDANIEYRLLESKKLSGGVNKLLIQNNKENITDILLDNEYHKLLIEFIIYRFLQYNFRDTLFGLIHDQYLKANPTKHLKENPEIRSPIISLEQWNSMFADCLLDMRRSENE